MKFIQPEHTKHVMARDDMIADTIPQLAGLDEIPLLGLSDRNRGRDVIYDSEGSEQSEISDRTSYTADPEILEEEESERHESDLVYSDAAVNILDSRPSSASMFNLFVHF